MRAPAPPREREILDALQLVEFGIASTTSLPEVRNGFVDSDFHR
jgi:hypothetical protein